MITPRAMTPALPSVRTLVFLSAPSRAPPFPFSSSLPLSRCVCACLALLVSPLLPFRSRSRAKESRDGSPSKTLYLTECSVDQNGMRTARRVLHTGLCRPAGLAQRCVLIDRRRRTIGTAAPVLKLASMNDALFRSFVAPLARAVPWQRLTDYAVYLTYRVRRARTDYLKNFSTTSFALCERARRDSSEQSETPRNISFADYYDRRTEAFRTLYPRSR